MNPVNGINSSFLAFGTEERIRNLLDSNSAFMDGTLFKVTPSPFYQLFTINFMKRCAISNVDKLFTGLTFLLTHNSEFMYHSLFAWIQEFYEMFYVVQGDNVDQLPALDTLVEYIEGNWMRIDIIPLWNINFPNKEDVDDAGMHRTNNDLEGSTLDCSSNLGRSPISGSS